MTGPCSDLTLRCCFPLHVFFFSGFEKLVHEQYGKRNMSFPAVWTFQGGLKLNCLQVRYVKSCRMGAKYSV